MSEIELPSVAYVGRDGAVVPDPMNAFRPVLPQIWLDSLDHSATRLSPALAAEREATLQTRRAELATAADGFDRARGTSAKRWSAAIDESTSTLARLHEDFFVAMGRARGRGREAEWSDPVRELREAIREAATRHESLREQPQRVADVVYVNEFFGHLPGASEQVSELIALDRELAIRQELQALAQRQPSRSADVPDGTTVKEIGTERGAEAVKRERERIDDSAMVLGGRRPWKPMRSLGREDVPHPRLLEDLELRLGERRIEELRKRAVHLEGFVALRRDHAIAERRSELGSLPEGPNGDAARRTLTLERLSTIVEIERDKSLANAKRHAERDPERAAVEQRTADMLGEKLASNQRELDEMRTRGVHPDQWVMANEDTLIRVGVHQREQEIRRRLEIAQRVESSVGYPPPHVERQVGRPRERDHGTRGEYEALVREIETTRLERQSAERAGLEPPERDPHAEAALSERIDDYRVSRGMEPTMQTDHQRALAHGGPGYG